MTTNQELILKVIKEEGGKSISLDKLIAKATFEYKKLNAANVAAEVTKMIEDPAMPVQKVKGGYIAFMGHDHGALYAAVEAQAPKFFTDELGLRDPEIANTSRGGKKGSGDLVHPDMVISAYPKRRPNADSPFDLHAIEVEHATGFKIQSVYQAFEQGRGAEFCWVIFPRLDPTERLYKRATRVAAELGVGMITYEKPTVLSSWQVVEDMKDGQKRRFDAKRQPFNHFQNRTEPLTPALLAKRRQKFIRNALGHNIATTLRVEWQPEIVPTDDVF